MLRLSASAPLNEGRVVLAPRNRDDERRGGARLYGWMKRRPEFAAQYAEACDWRAGWLEMHIEEIAAQSTPATFALARRQAAALQGRIGRLTPKLYRTATGS